MIGRRHFSICALRAYNLMIGNVLSLPLHQVNASPALGQDCEQDALVKKPLLK
jgi:hypothetical protein